MRAQGYLRDAQMRMLYFKPLEHLLVIYPAEKQHRLEYKRAWRRFNVTDRAFSIWRKAKALPKVQ